MSSKTVTFSVTLHKMYSLPTTQLCRDLVPYPAIILIINVLGYFNKANDVSQGINFNLPITSFISFLSNIPPMVLLLGPIYV